MSDKPGLLVTGASGFVGRHVITLGRNRFDIVATGRGARPPWLPEDITWTTADLLDRASVASLPKDLPFALHLASETVPARFQSYGPLIESLEMTLNLCRHLQSGRLLFASSCLVYGASTQPLTEDAPVDPRGHYGLTKALCETAVLRAGDEGSTLETAVARPFNHIGAGMQPDLAVPSIVRRLLGVADGATVAMAGIDSTRDFLDVADIVEAYFAILTSPNLSKRTFNVASGEATRISDLVRILARILGKQIAGISFADQGNSRDDTSVVVGDARHLRAATDWAPRRTLEQSLCALVKTTV